jgi:HlyD family secretion protein
LKIAIVLLLTVTGLFIGGLFMAGPRLLEAMSSFRPEPDRTDVRMEAAVRDLLAESVKAPGEVEPHTKVDLSAEVSARIEQIPFREGDEVRKGDLVIKLDDRDVQAALDSSTAMRDGESFRLRAEQARLAGLESSLRFARKELERKRSLFSTGDVSQKDLDDIAERVEGYESDINATNYNISVVESSLASANAQIEQSEEALAKTVIVAPMDGVITALNAEVGELVVVGTMNNAGTVIMTIADLSRMILKAEVAEADVVKVAEGQRAIVHINAYPDEEFAGTVRQVALQRTMANDGTGYFKTEVEIDLRGQRIRSGLLANVDIEVATHDGIVVPSQAVVDRTLESLPETIRRDDPLLDRDKKIVPVVFVVRDGQVILTPVIPGPSNETHTVVRQGLEEGDVVVSGPYKVLESVEHEELVRDLDEDRDEADVGEGDGADDDDEARGEGDPAEAAPAGEPE